MMFVGCNIAINLNPPRASQADPVGSIYLVDVDFVSCETMINTFPFRATEQGTTVFTFDNIHFVGNRYFFGFTDGSATTTDVLHDGTINFATIGDIQDGTALDGFYTINVGTRIPDLTYTGGDSFDYAQKAYRRRG